MTDINITIEKLVAAGFAIESHNNNLHLVLHHHGVTTDYWPTKDKWIVRLWGNKGIGLDALFETLGIQTPV